jgi:hypothetical protein
MPNFGADLVITQKHNRGYIQPGGARPNNPAHFYGLDAEYFYVGAVTKPSLGAVTPIWVADPRIVGRYKLVGRTLAAPTLATGPVHILERHGSVPNQLGVIGCLLNIYMLAGVCKDLSSLLNGWDDFVTIYAGGLVETIQLGQRDAFNTDVAVEDQLNVVWGDVYGAGKLAFGIQFATQIVREVVDVTYGNNVQCGNCGPADDGTGRAYAVTKSSGAGSPGFPAELVYTPDGGLTKFGINITGVGATEDPVGVQIAGNTLIVFSATAIYWATINIKTGIPGAFTKVTAGLVAGKNLTDCYVLSANQIFFSALGGYIYFSGDITTGLTVLNGASATSNDLLRIAGDGQNTIVVTGASSTVVKSINTGATFATTTTTISGPSVDIKAVEVMDINRYWVGTTLEGRAFYTLNGGETWTEFFFTGTGTGNVRDIVAATDEVIHMLYDDGSTAYLLTTYDGGKDWARNDSGSDRIANWPVFTRGNRIAVPTASDSTIAANNLIIAGLAGDATNGIWLQGAAARL